MLKFQNTKTFLLKDSFSNWSEEGFVVSKIKNTVLWTYISSALNGKKTSGSFYEKELQKTNQE